jgi:uncharacterized protein (TIGR03435 family)
MAMAAICVASQDGKSLSFEVASAAPNRETSPGRERLQVNPGGLSLMKASLWFCIQWAYDVRSDQVSGPDWLRTLKFDIAAKTSAPATEAEMRRMMQTLMAERFKVVLHRETRTLDVYEMRIAKHGLKLTKVDSEESGEMDTRNGQGFYAFHHVTMTEFAQQIRSLALNKPVVDHTGLQDRYDLTLRFPAGDRPVGEAHGDMPSVMDLVEEQFGLKLELKKLPTEVLVIDRAEKTPIEN